MVNNSTPLRLASHQGGYVLREQLHEFESRQTVWRKIQRGEYLPVSERVLRLIDLPGLVPVLQAAVLCLPGAVVSHHAAASLHGFPRLPEKAEVTVPRHCTHRFDEVEVHRADDIGANSVIRVAGLPVTTPARTVFDLAATLSLRQLDHLVEELLLTNVVELEQLVAVTRAVGRRGKTGTGLMRQVLERRGRADYGPASVLERKGLAVLASSPSVPPAEQEYPIPWADDGRRFDLAYPSYRVAVEWDSRRWHGALDRMDSDRRRDRECASNGWVLLRFTWADVHERPDEVVASVLDVLAQRGLSVG